VLYLEFYSNILSTEMSRQMKLIPIEEFEKLKYPKNIPKNIEKDSFLNTEEKASSVLEQTSLPNDVKLELYSSLLRIVRHKLEDILDKPIPVRVIENQKEKIHDTKEGIISSAELTDDDNFLLSTISPKFLPAATNVMKILKRYNGAISWDKSGHVTFFNNELVPGSNIVDLLNYVTRDLKSMKAPPGINRFLLVCKAANVPSHVLSKSLKREWQEPGKAVTAKSSVTNSAKKIDLYSSYFKDWEAEPDNEYMSADENSEFEHSS